MKVNSEMNESDITKVVNGGFCIGCGACTLVAPAITVELNKYGEFNANLQSAGNDALREASAVCPFSNTADNESTIADGLYKQTCSSFDQRLGYYSNLYAGYSGEFRQYGSSGGIVTWLLAELLNRGLVDKVIRVGPSSDGGMYFGYEVVSDAESLKKGSTSFYYPVTMQTVLAYVKENPGRYAITAVPCFHKALRLLKKVEPTLRERIVFQVGIVCGQMKTSLYLDYLLTLSKANGEVVSACFRRKNEAGRADQYFFEATFKSPQSGQVETVTVPNRKIGVNWGMGLFKPKACDFCDDVFAENADIAVMDGWLDRYVNDGKGTSLVVVRNQQINDLLSSLLDDPTSLLEPISAEDVVKSQQGGLNHRRKGLRYRLFLARKSWYPNKRLNASNRQTPVFKFEQRLRILLRRLSGSALLVQKRIGNGLFTYNMIMALPLFSYKMVTKA
ncbi:MAG: Coenzyme F420 hydrogenase/dehydrogenase, beta subunit C-terminal domain, partial [Candidatus Methylumidiphilus sp.]